MPHAGRSDHPRRVDSPPATRTYVLMRGRLLRRSTAARCSSSSAGSGSGKSTLAEAHDRASTSRWRATCSSTATTSSPRKATRATRSCRKIGVMYQSGALFGSMTLLENVRLPLEELHAPSTLPPMDLIARMKLELVGLDAVHRPLAGRDQRRHAETRGDRARDGARPDDPVPRRAVGGARSHHVGRARRAHPPAGRQPGHHVRHRHPRAREHLHRSPIVSSCWTSASRASSPRRSEGPARRQHDPACASSSRRRRGREVPPDVLLPRREARSACADDA